MAAKIVSPLNRIVDVDGSAIYIEWEGSTDVSTESYYEVQYKLKSASAWSTCGKTASTHAHIKFPIMTIYNLVGVDFYEVYYRVLIWYDGTNKLGPVTGYEETPVYRLIFTHGIKNTLKVYDGLGTVQYPLYDTIAITNNNKNEVNVQKVSTTAATSGIKMLPVVTDSNNQKSNLNISLNDTGSSIVHAVKYPTNAEYTYMTPVSYGTTYIHQAALKDNYYYQYGYSANYTIYNLYVESNYYYYNNQYLFNNNLYMLSVYGYRASYGTSSNSIVGGDGTMTYSTIYSTYTYDVYSGTGGAWGFGPPAAAYSASYGIWPAGTYIMVNGFQWYNGQTGGFNYVSTSTQYIKSLKYSYAVAATYGYTTYSNSINIPVATKEYRYEDVYQNLWKTEYYRYNDSYYAIQYNKYVAQYNYNSVNVTTNSLSRYITDMQKANYSAMYAGKYLYYSGSQQLYAGYNIDTANTYSYNKSISYINYYYNYVSAIRTAYNGNDRYYKSNVAYGSYYYAPTYYYASKIEYNYKYYYAFTYNIDELYTNYYYYSYISGLDYYSYWSGGSKGYQPTYGNQNICTWGWLGYYAHNNSFYDRYYVTNIGFNYTTYYNEYVYLFSLGYGSYNVPSASSLTYSYTSYNISYKTGAYTRTQFITDVPSSSSTNYYYYITGAAKGVTHSTKSISGGYSVSSYYKYAYDCGLYYYYTYYNYYQ